MNIEHIDVFHVRLELRQLWKTAYGEESCVDTVLLKARDGDHVAWVESCPLRLPMYMPETAVSVFHTITDLFGPLIIGRDYDSIERLTDRLKPFRGNSFSKAGLELCWWALTAVKRDVPLRRLFGGGDSGIRCSDGFGIEQDVSVLIDRIHASVDGGYQRVKLKIRPGWDQTVVRAVRQEFPDLRLMVDCNGSFALDDLPMFQALDRLGLDMIEQPLYYRDLSDHSRLQAELTTPLCLDESVTSFADARRAVRMNACGMINLKIGRVGGLSECLRIRDECETHGVGCWVGSMLESGIGTAINVELATLFGADAVHEVPVCGTFHTRNLVDPPITFDPPGVVTPADGAYTGRAVNEDLVRKLAIAHRIISTADK